MQPLTLSDIHDAYLQAMFRFLGGGANIKMVETLDSLRAPDEPKMRHELVGWAPVHASVVEALNWWHAFDDRAKSEWRDDWGPAHEWPRRAMAWVGEAGSEAAMRTALLRVPGRSRGRTDEPGEQQRNAVDRILEMTLPELRLRGVEQIHGTVRGARFIRNAAHHDWAHVLSLHGGANHVTREMACQQLQWSTEVASSQTDARKSSYVAHMAGELVQVALYDLLHVGLVAVGLLEHERERTRS